jgi:dipeptidyl aminopeptidase/acylaminoacyl peptidase
MIDDAGAIPGADRKDLAMIRIALKPGLNAALIGSVLAALLATTAPAAVAGEGPADRTRADGAGLEAQVRAIASIRSSLHPAPAPDGRSFAFISDASGIPQVWVQRGSGAPVQLTRSADPVQSVHWSAKGDMLVYDVAPGGGYNIRIHVVRPDGSGDRNLTARADVNNRLYGWTPDGRIRAATAWPDPARFQAQLIDPATGAITNVGSPAASLSFPILSQDGRFAVLEKLVTRGDMNLHLVDLTSGRETLLTPHRGLALHHAIGMSPDGRRLWLRDNARQDRLGLSVIDIDATGTPSPPRTLLVRRDAELHAGVMSTDGSTLALLWNAAGRSELDWFATASDSQSRGPALGRTRPPVDVLYQPIFAPGQKLLYFTGLGAAMPQNIFKVEVASNDITRLTDSAHPGVDLSTMANPVLVEYVARDGVPLSGWLYRPAGVTGPGPVVFHYHGGPEAQARPFLDESNQALVASGISVFAPNVRGSYGYGKAFLALDNGPLRVNGVRDIEDTTNHLVKAGIADPKRLGIMGGSYGGYMVMAGVTEFPTMFAAGANLFGIANFETFFKHSTPWMGAVSKVEYGDPDTQADMLRSLSPIHKIDRVTTPLLILHGANDTNVPVIEAEQIVASLKARNVPVGYILFPDEGHGWRKLPNRVKSTTEITRFFVEHLVE